MSARNATYEGRLHQHGVFPAERVDARFVLSMSMAKNDVERALRDVIRAGENDDPDFSYRVRLVTGHLVEAVDALNQYSQTHEAVRKLIARVPPEAREHLKTVRSTLQKAGPKVLDHVRDNTFHYPSPDPKYQPTSDEQLQDTLAAIAEKRAEVFADFEKGEVTLTFADEVALALALGQHSANESDLRRQLEIARDGAVAFRAWAEALAVACLEANDLHFGEPEYNAGMGSPGGLHAGGGRPTEAFAAFCGRLRVDRHFCDKGDPQAKGVVERLQDFAERSFEPGRIFRERARLCE